MQTCEPELRALMILALDGDGRAYRALLADLRLRLAGFFARRADAAEADDLVQDTLLAIHTRRETYDRRQPLLPWVYAIARYKLVDALRRRGRRAQAPLEDVEHELASPDEAAAVEARLDVQAILADLPERARALLVSLRIEGISVAEASQRFGMSEGAVKVASHRAMKGLAARFGSGGVGDE
jgi:RNA polymerase sigma-70 factor (ECF subfamily)